MKKFVMTPLLITVLALPAAAEEKQDAKAAKKPETSSKPVPLPDGMNRFNGMLVGRLVKKDVEKGTFQVTVDRVARVWRNSKAENPKSVVGKTISVEGVFGKFLDVLLLLKVGETLEFESRHDGGDVLTFPGELLRKVPPVKPGEYPEIPEEFRGFHGVVTGKIVKKDAELLELIIKVDKVKETGKKNKAKKPESIAGKRLLVAGFWQRKEVYGTLKVGDTIETGLQHISPRSDHVSVADSIRIIKGKKTSGESKDEE